VLTVDGKEVDRKTIPHTIPLLMAIDETFDIGIDTRTPVDFTYDVPFRFTGTIDKLTYNLGPSQLSAEDQKTLFNKALRLGRLPESQSLSAHQPAQPQEPVISDFFTPSGAMGS
jgi:hypothetical protein